MDARAEALLGIDLENRAEAPRFAALLAEAKAIRCALGALPRSAGRAKKQREEAAPRLLFETKAFELFFADAPADVASAGPPLLAMSSGP